MSVNVLWTSASRFHDWSDLVVPGRLARSAAGAGVIGSADWVELGFGGDRTGIPEVEARDVPDLLIRHLGMQSGTRIVAAGGGGPVPWEMSVVVAEFLPKHNQARGYSVIRIVFDSRGHADEQGSARLIETFRTAHSPSDTEFAAIHPEHRWATLRGAEYEDAVVIGPMLAGVHWANFLGPGHLDEFDRDALSGIDAHLVEWVDDGLFLVVSPTLADAETPAVEQRMFALTEVFRRARRT